METKIDARIALPLAAFGSIVLLALVGSIVSLGNQLSSIHWTLGLIYYLLVLALIVVGIVYPIARTFARPVFGLYKLHEGSDRSQAKHFRLLESNLRRVKGVDKTSLRLPDKTNETMSAAEFAAIFKSLLEPMADSHIKKAAKAAFTTTAISQAPAFDMVSVMAVNLRMVRAIVEDCGYRPSAPALLGLYVRAMKATIIAGGLEEMDFEEVMALIGGNAALTASSVVFSSAAQGAANAFLTVRVGVITKALLFSEEGPADMRELRRSSYGEALAFLKSCGLMDDLRQAMASVAGSARDAAMAKAADMKDAAVSKATGMRDAATRQMADFREDAMERIAGIKDATSERMADLKGDMAKRASAAKCNPQRQSQPGYTVSMPRRKRND